MRSYEHKKTNWQICQSNHYYILWQFLLCCHCLYNPSNQSYIRQYGLFLKQMGYAPYIYPAVLIQCPKDFTPYIFSKSEIHRIFKCADRIGPNKNNFMNTPHIYPAILRLLYACGTRIGEALYN